MSPIRSGASSPANHRDARETERGSQSLEITILFVVVLLVVFTIVQGAWYYHARNTALHAATAGVRIARVEGATNAEGSGQAHQFLKNAGGAGVLKQSSVSISRSATQVTVVVEGVSPSMIPGFGGFPVRQEASGPIERFTTPEGQ